MKYILTKVYLTTHWDSFCRAKGQWPLSPSFRIMAFVEPIDDNNPWKLTAVGGGRWNGGERLDHQFLHLSTKRSLENHRVCFDCSLDMVPSGRKRQRDLVGDGRDESVAQWSSPGKEVASRQTPFLLKNFR